MTHTSARVSDGNPKLKRIRGIPSAIPALLPQLANKLPFPFIIAFVAFVGLLYWVGHFVLELVKYTKRFCDSRENG